MCLDELINLVYSEFENCKVSPLKISFETSGSSGQDPELGFDKSHPSSQPKGSIQSSKL